MKKFLFPITIIMVAALLLSACAGGVNTEVTPGTGALNTPEAGGTPVGGADTLPTAEVTSTVEMATPVDAGDMETPTGETGAAPTEEASPTLAVTPDETGSPEATVTLSAEELETPVAGAGDSTPQAGAEGVPSAGVEGENFVRLSTLLNASINSSDNQAAGEIDGLLVEHPFPPVTAEEGGEAAATPTASAAAETPQEFTVRYVLLDVSTANLTSTTGSTAGGNSGRIVAVPWQALNIAGQQSDDTIALFIDSDTLASAPRHSLTDIASGTDWREDTAGYWSGQGIVGIPATGAAEEENLALIPRNFQGITISDLEENDLGAAADIVIDAATGRVEYLVVNGGEAFGNRTFAVPMSHLSWLGNVGTQLGSFQFNFPSESLENAPELDLDMLPSQFDATWRESINQFWESIQNQ